MLPMSTTRYVVKCEVTPPPLPPVPLGNSRRGLCGSIPVGGGFQARRVRRTLLATCPLN